jgi:hypothetical protein
VRQSCVHHSLGVDVGALVHEKVDRSRMVPLCRPVWRSQPLNTGGGGGSRRTGGGYSGGAEGGDRRIWGGGRRLVRRQPLRAPAMVGGGRMGVGGGRHGAYQGSGARA